MAETHATPAPSDPRQEVARGNPWYTDDQVVAATGSPQRRVIAKRHAFFLRTVRALLERHPPSPLRVLDAGCGDGVLLDALSSIPGLFLHGVDYTEGTMEALLSCAGLVVRERMREGFFTPHSGVHAWLNSRDWGHRFLERLGGVFPSQVAGFYFLCRRAAA